MRAFPAAPDRPRFPPTASHNRAGPAQFGFEKGVDRQIGFGDGAAAFLAPALVVAAEIVERNLACRADAAFEKS